MSNRERSSQTRTWFITGASSGIGKALVEAAARDGDNVVGVARHIEGLAELAETSHGRILVREADVTDRDRVETVVKEAIESFGRIDVVANNAGYGLFGAVEETSIEQVKAIFDTNVYGVLNVLWATLPILRKQKSGHILQGSSYLGQTTHSGLGLLSATKYAVEAISDALVEELAPLGIRVTLVEPSLTATPFLSNLAVAESIADYDATVRALLKAVGEIPAEAYNAPEKVAKVLIDIVDAQEPPTRFATGSQAVQEIREALAGRIAQLDEWQSLSTSVDTPASTVGA
jgi:NADP-dependent 3-hydroxy acid dehydrogenase YdfG